MSWAECLGSLPRCLRFGRAQTPNSLSAALGISPSQHLLPPRSSCAFVLGFCSCGDDQEWVRISTQISRVLLLWLPSVYHLVPPIVAIFAQNSNFCFCSISMPNSQKMLLGNLLEECWITSGFSSLSLAAALC